MGGIAPDFPGVVCRSDVGRGHRRPRYAICRQRHALRLRLAYQGKSPQTRTPGALAPGDRDGHRARDPIDAVGAGGDRVNGGPRAPQCHEDPEFVGPCNVRPRVIDRDRPRRPRCCITTRGYAVQCTPAIGHRGEQPQRTAPCKAPVRAARCLGHRACIPRGAVRTVTNTVFGRR